MNPFRTLLVRFRSLFCRDKRQTELTEEIQAHRELRIDELRQTGSSADEARRQARLEFDHMDSAKEAMCSDWLRAPEPDWP